ncbi:MAG: PGF-CTERM sorting domain-containing protein [Archaeoglobaceae archaeon]
MKILAIILIALLSMATALAIKPLEDQLPPNVPKENVTIREEIEEGTIVVKQTNMSIARIHEPEAKANELVEIKLRITNGENSEMKVFVTEFHVAGLEYPDPIEVKFVKYQAFKLPYYGWSLSVPAKSSKEIVYHIKASIPTTIKILCNANGVCEKGESYANCPEDCETGIADDNCDGVKDDKVDPDCAPGFDPDSTMVTPTVTPTATPKAFIPGFESIFAITALIAVFYLLRRRD